MSHDVNKCAPRIEGVTPHNFAYIRNKAFACSHVLYECSCRFSVVNTLENVQIVQSFSDDRLQCLHHFDLNKFLKSLPHNKISLAQIQSIPNKNVAVAEMMISLFDEVENIVVKGAKIGDQHFLLFPQYF